MIIVFNNNYVYIIMNVITLFQIGPEKGVIQLACCAVLNALWDLWGKREGKVNIELIEGFRKRWGLPCMVD